VIGHAIRKSRLKAGLTQEEVAFRAKVSRNYVSLLELDQKSPTVAVLIRVASAIGTKASKLLTEAGN
jgi:transcriptional regulator with XRE-family HTH domain